MYANVAITMIARISTGADDKNKTTWSLNPSLENGAVSVAPIIPTALHTTCNQVGVSQCHAHVLHVSTSWTRRRSTYMLSQFSERYRQQCRLVATISRCEMSTTSTIKHVATKTVVVMAVGVNIARLWL